MSEDLARRLMKDHGKQAYHKTVQAAAYAAQKGDKRGYAVLANAAKVMMAKGMHKNATRSDGPKGR